MTRRGTAYPVDHTNAERCYEAAFDNAPDAMVVLDDRPPRWLLRSAR